MTAGWIADYRERRLMRKIRSVLDVRDVLMRTGADEAVVAAMTQEAEELAEELLRKRRTR